MSLETHYEMPETGVLNLTGTQLTQTELHARLSTCDEKDSIHTLIIDDCFIRKIENYGFGQETLIQFSLAQNQLTRTFGIQQFLKIRVLNLSSNLLIQLDGIDQLPYLEWFSVAGNQLRNVDIVNKCFKLVHLDVSDNQLTNLPKIHSVTSLQTLLLHQNLIRDLKSTSEYLPSNIEILSLANNEISDLNMIEYLSTLHKLDQLSLSKNPCVSQDLTELNLPAINCRPFVLNWCHKLTILNGISVSERERIKGEWLLSQGYGRSFAVGQHIELITYLSTVCPHNKQDNMVDNEDMKLDKILELKHQLHHNRGNTDQTSSPSKPKSPSKTTERPLPSPGKRVSEHEKQKRIHAWLGDQSTEVLLPKPTPSLPPPSAGKLPAPELPHFTLDDKRTTRGHSQDESDTCHNLLASESEFISGDELPLESDSPRKAVRPRVATSPQRKSKMESASPKKANVPYSAYDSLGMIQQLYDSPIMTSQPHDTNERWAYPAHSNFPNDETMTTIVPKLALAERSPPLPQEIDSAQSLTVNPSLSAGGNLVPEELRYYTEDDTSLSMSKYEEYEMRPIKPLNTELRLELFGPSSHNNTSSKPRPLPLKKNTGSTSRHSVTKLRTSSGKENTPAVTRSSKKQSNVSTKKTVSSPVKRETLSRVSKVSMSPRCPVV
uniref:centrosomal protein of 97 kDa-like n=1 Tax=Ciona intestinalis TaxID=7719 RepID=UPI000EF4FA2C|nr:centrosomal protein of 97 kDa-like [Ciona intestinalis]|eukprot:XP_026690656.1 centrosomal protein of 97 kDa-like [Ciona intestinalis]